MDFSGQGWFCLAKSWKITISVLIFAYVIAKKNKSATSKKANIKKYSISIEGKITKSSAAGENFWMFYYKKQPNYWYFC